MTTYPITPVTFERCCLWVRPPEQGIPGLIQACQQAYAGTRVWHRAEHERREPRTLYRGVSRLEKERKWVARVWVDSKQRTLGRFDSDVAAAQVLHPLPSLAAPIPTQGGSDTS